MRCGDLIERCLPQVRARVHRQLQGDFRARHPWMMAVFSTGDVVQDVLLAVARESAAMEFESEEEAVRYLSTVARNRLIDAVRHHEAARRDRRREAPAGDAESPTRQRAPESIAGAAEQIGLLRVAMDELPPRHRALLDLRLVDGLPFPQIARDLGYSSAETARQAFVEAQAKLLLKLRARGVRPG